MQPPITKLLTTRYAQIEEQVANLKKQGLEALKEKDMDVVESTLQLVDDLKNEIKNLEDLFEIEVNSVVNSRLRYLRFEIRQGKYYSGWNGKSQEGWQVYTQELSAQELKALEILTGRKRWEQAPDGRLYYSYPAYRDTCWTDSDGQRTTNALSDLFPALLSDLNRLTSLEAALS